MFFVVHIKSQVKAGNHRVYCGRPSIFGNPFTMHGEKTRNAVCNQYAEHFDTARKDPMFQAALDALIVRDETTPGDTELACFCAPRRCHCETIAKYLNA